jgi:CRP/FNR family transcriptional regulator/CRP/FNR family cyclic AMP-dependent transcriptional regulator
MAATPFLRRVPKREVVALAGQGKVHRFRRGTYICHQGDDTEEVFFLVEGKIEIASFSPTGARILHATVDAPQFVGELGVFGDLPRTADLLALDDSEIWSVDGETFLAFVTAQPALARDVLRALARQVQEHQAFADDLLFLDLKGRVAKRLLQMGTSSLADLPSDGTSIAPITHADLASLCGGSRENVTRTLKEFERRGLIRRDGGRYVLKKVAALAKIADL